MFPRGEDPKQFRQRQQLLWRSDTRSLATFRRKNEA
jgi:hypothetical protein